MKKWTLDITKIPSGMAAFCQWKLDHTCYSERIKGLYYFIHFLQANSAEQQTISFVLRSSWIYWM